MARLYAATGNGIVRLDEIGEAWTVVLSLSRSGAQCLAVDPIDPDIVYVGLHKGGVRRSVDGGRTWVDCKLPEPGVFSLAVSAADGAVRFSGRLSVPSNLSRVLPGQRGAVRGIVGSKHSSRGPKPRHRA